MPVITSKKPILVSREGKKIENVEERIKKTNEEIKKDLIKNRIRQHKSIIYAQNFYVSNK